MQKLIILLILLHYNQLVKSESIFEYMFKRLVLIKDSIIDSALRIQTQLQDALLPPVQIPQQRVRRPRMYDQTSAVIRSQPEAMHHYVRPDLNLTCNRPTHSLTTPQLSAIDGRIMETHVTVTSDGYILTLHRLHCSITKGQTNNQEEKRTILLHHGLLGSSADWILLGPKKSLPFLLSDAGHDVWLANARGNYYSRAHVSLNVDSEKYWNFSWQEMGEYDLPATLDYIRWFNNSTEPIDYIGHSIGATALLVLLSAKRNYNSYFRIAILLAPLAFMRNTRGSMQKLARINKSELTALFGTQEFMPTRRTPVSLSLEMCHDLDDFCNNTLFFLTGSPLQDGTRGIEFKDKLQKYAPAGSSMKTIRHCLELISNGKFHHYGNPDLTFNLKFVITPIFIISSNDDLISNAADNQDLLHAVSNPVGHIIIVGQNLSHSEFVWGLNAEVLIYNKIRDFIDVGPNINEIFR